MAVSAEVLVALVTDGTTLWADGMNGPVGHIGGGSADHIELVIELLC